MSPHGLPSHLCQSQLAMWQVVAQSCGELCGSIIALPCTMAYHKEHPHQWMQKFCKFAHLKPTFSILHSHFYKTPTSVCLLYTFIQIKYSSSSTINDQSTPTINPPSHHHQPPSPQNPLIK